MPSRLMQGLITLVFVFVLFGAIGTTQAQSCCTIPPNYFFTVSVIGTPECDYQRHTGRVQWSAQYYLPSPLNFFVWSYGDGVIQGGDFYPNLPRTASVATFSDQTIWTWEPFHPVNASYKVRVEFDVTAPTIDSVARSLIVFDCTPRGVQNLTVYNTGLWPDPPV